MVEYISPPTTRVEIISYAVSLCGKQQTVNTVDGGGTLATDANRFFDLIVSAELASNRWRFAQEFQQLSVVNTLTPSFDNWLYYREIPSDCLMVLYVTPRIEYVVFGNKILTNTDQPATLVYTKDVPVSKWPGAFSMYITYHVASMIGISVTNSDRLLARIAEGLNMWESRALFADGQNSRGKSIQSNPWVDARYQSSTRRGR